jgi:hypothetical protein
MNEVQTLFQQINLLMSLRKAPKFIVMVSDRLTCIHCFGANWPQCKVIETQLTWDVFM